MKLLEFRFVFNHGGLTKSNDGLKLIK